MPYFSLALIKAVNAWQAGSLDKRKKAKKLKEVIKEANLDQHFVGCDDPCFRRSVLSGGAVKELLFEFQISEETSAWTTRQSVAALFKDGPPDPPLPGVIFKHSPQSEEVLLNLARLYDHPEFMKSVEHWEGKGLDFGKGIRRYLSSQFEVIMNVNKVLHDEIFAFGSNAGIGIAAGEMQGRRAYYWKG